MTATSGRPGPVVLSLPEDMLTDRAGVAGRAALAPRRSGTRARGDGRAAPAAAGAQRPFVILGGGGGTPRPPPTSPRFARGQRAAGRGCGFRRQDLLDNDHPCYAGDIAIGPNPKLVERDQRRRSPDRDRHAARRDDDARATRCSTSRAPPSASSTSTTTRRSSAGSTRPTLPSWPAWARSRRRWRRCRRSSAGPGPRRTRGRARRLSRLARAGPDPRRAAAWARSWPGCAARLPADAIVTNGAGNYAIWVNRFFAYRGLRHPARPDLRLDGLRPAGRRSRPSSSTRAAGRRASPATAAS